MDTVIIITAWFEPNPAGAGSATLLKVIAMEAQADPATQVYLAGEFVSGEV